MTVSFFTALVVKYGETLAGPIAREVIGDPVHVFASQVPAEAGAEAVARMLPNGVDDTARQVMTADESGGVNDLTIGVPVGIAKVRLVVQAKESRLLVVGLRLVVTERRPPLAATLLAVGTQGGPGKPVQVFFDVDAPGADTKQGTPARNLERRDYFKGENFELDANQSVEFRAAVTTRECHCRWHLEVDVVLDGKLRSVAARQPDGRDFESTGAVPDPTEVYTIPHTPVPNPLATAGPWVGVDPREFCAPDSWLGELCDPTAWPAP
ncbi:hypothetical protein GCM10009634_47200 [Saccharothrix xinjiangensis]